MAPQVNNEVLKQEERSRLRAKFDDLPPEQHGEGWNELWAENFTPWDRNEPSPALIDTLIAKKEILGAPWKEDSAKSDEKVNSRKKALVPGCGKGYDVHLLASYGYDAYGLDISQQAIDRAASQFTGGADVRSKYPESDVYGSGRVNFVHGDFFKDDFFEHTNGGGFDVIYDYTFLCALPFSLRPAWAKRMTQLLEPEGRLICLEFPLMKRPETGGPPHGLRPELYEQLLYNPGRELKYTPSGWVLEDRSNDLADDALVRIDRWKAERSHPAGQGEDHVSIWRHVRNP